MKKDKKTSLRKSTHKPNYCIACILPAILIVALDQITKYAIRSSLILGKNNPIIPYILDFTYLQNTGAAWGILKNNNMLFIWIYLIALGIILYNYESLPKPKFAMSFILAGIIGNFMDRIFLGHVVDFIDFKFWPVFNVADSAISIGAAIIIIYGIREDLISSRKHIS
ncbi:MAG: signal peptidase II [archaeon]